MVDGHGDDLFHYKEKVKINFSTNIPQTVNHDGLVTHLYRFGAVFKNYPEPEPRSVEKRLAELHGTTEGHIFVTNGVTEAIYLIAQAFAGKKSAIIVPTFREYQDACRVFHHEVKFIGSLTEIKACQPDLVWLCNPNNPT
ncbi:MAG: aminotransferase class I/II-fold pyridoxal phosphate-dependent enzyme, partial [Barnesiella sp.]|nr:aminotransferase class I/II-fold pyridoxal phosphate-dependent enzyme [Barnesiella sp.]